MERNILEITYNQGRGNFTVNLDRLMPCTQKQFKMILDMVDMSNDPAALVNHLNNYFCDQMEEKTMKEFCYINRIKLESYQKKMDALKDILISRYDIENDQESEKMEKTRCKRAVVNALHHENGEKVIKQFPGYTFEKAGYHFTVHKDDRGYFLVCLYGIQVWNREKSKAAAVNSITDEIISKIDKIGAENLNSVKSDYINAMLKAGYMTEEEAIEMRNTPVNERFAAVKAFEPVEAVKVPVNAVDQAEKAALDIKVAPEKKITGIKTVCIFRCIRFLNTGRDVIKSAIGNHAKCALDAYGLRAIERLKDCLASSVLWRLANDPDRLSRVINKGCIVRAAINAGLSPP